MNTTSNNTTSALLAVPYQLNICVGLSLWVLGNVGCIGNIIVFSSEKFRQRAYGIYLLFEAVSSFIYFDFLLLTRILQNGFQIPVTARYDLICKVRQFDSVWNPVVSFNLFAFAIIDRILSLQHSNKYHQFGNRVQLAYKICIGCIVFWLLFFGHRLILYSTINGKCGPRIGFYAYFDNYLEASVTAMGVPVAMFILAVFLLRSVRNAIRRKIAPNNERLSIVTRQQTAIQRMDSKLTSMLVLRIAVALITRIPYVIELIYTNITQNWSKSALQSAIENIIIELIRLLAYTFFTAGFYISFFSDHTFRRILKQFFSKIKMR